MKCTTIADHSRFQHCTSALQCKGKNDPQGQGEDSRFHGWQFGTEEDQGPAVNFNSAKYTLDGFVVSANTMVTLLTFTATAGTLFLSPRQMVWDLCCILSPETDDDKCPCNIHIGVVF